MVRRVAILPCRGHHCELVGAVEGTNAFAALRILSDDRVEAYLCDGAGEEPSIQSWLSGTRSGNEVFLMADNPYHNVTLSGSLLGESFEGEATINGEAYAVSLLGATRPDGLYNVTFEDGLRRGWIVIGDEERGPVQTLFKSNPIAFNDGAYVNISSAGVVKMKTRFTAGMLDGYTSSPLAPGQFLVEVSGITNWPDVPAIFSKAKLKSASNNQELELVYAPNLSSAGRAVLIMAPAFQLQSLPLVDTFTVEIPNASGIMVIHEGNELVQSRLLVVRM